MGTASTPAGPSVVQVDRSELGESRGSLRIDERDRGWRLYIASSLPSTGKVPLVVGLHGGFGSGEQFAADDYFDAQAERGGFIAVYPDGISRRVLDIRTWNAGNCCGEAVKRKVDDVGFIDALLDQLVSELPVDEDRVYVTGHSNGAMMGHRLACKLSDRIVAIAVVAGSLEAPCSPSQTISILSIHGDADLTHPLDGGVGPEAINKTDYNSVANSIASWRSFNACEREPVVTSVGPIFTETWSCADGTEVSSLIVAGASHSWPGGKALGPLRPKPSLDLDASSTV
jgi:polyhydroxybutyrate depolymerase